MSYTIVKASSSKTPDSTDVSMPTTNLYTLHAYHNNMQHPMSPFYSVLGFETHRQSISRLRSFNTICCNHSLRNLENSQVIVMRKLGEKKQDIAIKPNRVDPALLHEIIHEKMEHPNHHRHYWDESIDSGVNMVQTEEELQEYQQHHQEFQHRQEQKAAQNENPPPGTPIIPRSMTIKKNLKQSRKRLQTIQERNRNLPPHLRSSYVFEELLGLEPNYCDSNIADERTQ